MLIDAKLVPQHAASAGEEFLNAKFFVTAATRIINIAQSMLCICLVVSFQA